MMTTLAQLESRSLCLYLDVVLHALTTGKRPHSETRDKLMFLIEAVAHNDPQVAAYMAEEISAYNAVATPRDVRLTSNCAA